MAYKSRIYQEEGTCLECGDSFRGRKGRKFCSLECKNSYNNRKTRDINLVKRDTLKKISRNYEILEMLISDDVTSIGRDRLAEYGFDEAYVTGQRVGDAGHHECRCFDIVYCQTALKIFNIRREAPTSP